MGFPFDNAQDVEGLTSGSTYSATPAAANKTVLAALCAAGGDYRLPEGHYRVGGTGTLCAVSKDTTFRGPIGGRCVLQIGPDTTLSSTTLFEVAAGKTLRLLGNIDVQGPPNVTYGVQVDFSDTVASYGARVSTGGSLDVDGCTFSKFIQCIKQEGAGELAVRNSQIRGRTVGIISTSTVANTFATIEDCSFGLDTDDGRAIGQCHNVYIYRGVNLTVRDSRFYRGFTYGVLAGFGGAETPARQRLISGCTFSGMTRPVYCGTTGSTRVENCEFDSSGDATDCAQITAAGTFEVEGCTFQGLASYTNDQSAFIDDQTTTASGTFTRCRFAGQYIYMVYRVTENATSPINFSKCYFAAPYSGGYTIGSLANCGRVFLDDCEFGKTSGDLGNASPNARISARNCYRTGGAVFSDNL